MARNASLTAARAAKANEFYTQWVDIESEMNAYLEYDPDVFRGKTILLPCDDPEWSNFTKFFALHFVEYGLTKLISTSYAPNSNADASFYEPTLFELDAPAYDKKKSFERGRVFTLTADDISGDGRVDIDDLRWEYLEGDGDFRSPEVTALRDMSDVVITNPPFTEVGDFVEWLIEGQVKFSLIGPRSLITYKRTFPLIRDNKMWIGKGFTKGNAYFRIPEEARSNYAKGVYDPETKLVHFRNCTWFTNLEHGRRHEPLELLSMSDNLKYSRFREVREYGYREYVNLDDAIEVPRVSAIPKDYAGIMGVPITFLDTYNPDQFEVLASADDMDDMKSLGALQLGQDFVDAYYAGGGTGGISAGHRKLGLLEPRVHTPYKRILIRNRNPEVEEPAE